jgi:hypothetical protein
MGVIVEIVTGPAAGRKFDVPDGASVSFGRTEKSRFAIPDDAHLSGAHFSIECRGGKCKLRDLSSTNGTFVGGVKVAEAEIGPEEVFAAGSSTFRLRRGAAEEWIGFGPRHKTILSILYGYGQPVFAVLDAAREDRLPAFLQAYGADHAPLSEGDSAGQLKEGAPYVVLLPKTSPLLKLLMNEGWGKGWGVFFNSAAPFADVRKHRSDRRWAVPLLRLLRSTRPARSFPDVHSGGERGIFWADLPFRRGGRRSGAAPPV